MSSVSTDWSIQSILINSDFPIFIDLLIDKSIMIFIDWLLRVNMYGSVNSKCAHPLPRGIYCPNVFCFVLFCFWKSCKCPTVGPGGSYKNPMVGWKSVQLHHPGRTLKLHFPVNSQFSRDITKIQTKKLSIIFFWASFFMRYYNI